MSSSRGAARRQREREEAELAEAERIKAEAERAKAEELARAEAERVEREKLARKEERRRQWLEKQRLAAEAVGQSDSAAAGSARQDECRSTGQAAAAEEVSKSPCRAKVCLPLSAAAEGSTSLRAVL
jgi:hypothetical protein